MEFLKFIVYSHTDYLDVLKIQTAGLKFYNNKILLINNNSHNLEDLYKYYNEVIFYDDTLPYANRLLSLSNLKDKYVLFIHDIDIIVKKDDSILTHIQNFMDKNSIDRIDLQVRSEWDRSNKDIVKINYNDLEIELRKQTNVNNYIYNVNPSIWKVSSFLDILNKFRDETYRTIENDSVMNYCRKYNIYKLYSNNPIKCGWFSCLSFFMFIHITHKGKLLPKTNNQLDVSLIPEYVNIIDKLFKYNTNKKFFEGSIR